MAPLPMFPLGSVLFPGTALPLRVFEPRYRALVEDVTKGDGPPEFGVVLIERGIEVGGGDVRFGVGTVARIVQVEPNPIDGTLAVLAIGVRRFRVVGWLPDDPYPCADVDEFDDVDSATVDLVEPVIARLRRTLAIAAEAGVRTAPATVEFSEEPMIKLWQGCAVAPVGPLDDLALLSAPSVHARVNLLDELLRSQEALLAPRLSGD